MERRSARGPDRSVAGGPHALTRQSVDLLALREVPFILFESGFALNRIILDACHRRGFELNVVARSSQIDFIVALCRHRHGAAFLPRMIAEQRKHASVARVPLAEADMDWYIAMIWRRGAYVSHAAKAWLDLVPTTRGKERAANHLGPERDYSDHD